MKKLTATTIIIMIFAFSTACGGDDEGYYNNYNGDDYYIYEQVTDYTIDDTDTQLPQMHFLEDLDYMQYVMETNFDLFDVAYWAHGVHISTIFENIRANIYDNPNINADEFLNLLLFEFHQLAGVAHFEVVSPSGYWGLSERSLVSPQSMDRIRSPHVRDFYTSRHADASVLSSVAALSALPTRFKEMHVESIALYNGKESSEAFIDFILTGNYEAAHHLLQQANQVRAAESTIVTEIIEDDQIAYIAINSFGFRSNSGMSDIVNDFFEEVQDFEHLIVDLRRNRGGDPANFKQLIMSPIIPETIVLDDFAFTMAGSYTDEFFPPEQQWRGTARFREVPVNDSNVSHLPISELLEAFDLPEFNIEDKERLTYGFRLQRTINSRHLARFDMQPAFNGEIWLLTGPLMTSASEVSARIAKNTGFATLVGQRTGGAYGGQRIIVALPNTGILFIMDTFYITDSYGRPYEAGTYPHYFNRDGMDALETTLQLITEFL